ncbi:MAG: insulinase family protein [Bacteroidales bacterium]|nr:insulinase family protein [Bacteroidales bacterium]MCL2133611.1 insulinase family protein [Bacteroidales bacterium]
MKKLINIIALFLIIVAANAQQLDRSIKPAAAAAKAIDIKDAEIFTLPNGLKVFVVEDKRAPIVLYSVSLDIYPALEGDKAGMQDLFTSVMGTATKTLEKEELNREIDLIGARIYSGSRGGSARGLKKHETRMLELLSDILLNPVFVADELELNRKKTLSALELLGDDIGSLNMRVSDALTYGKNYPEGEVQTKESIENISLNDFENFHQTYFAPNVARLVVVGDITLAEAKVNAEKYFGKWAKKNVPTTKYAIPAAPAANKVAFIEKPGAVQSAIDVSYPVELHPAAPDLIAANIMSYVMGGGMNGRLTQNLREKRSYTYGVYNFLSPNELIGRYQLSSGRGAAQVKAAATDSAVYFIREEMQGLINTPITEQELADAKSYFAGSFGRSLEDPNTLASFAINIDKYNLPKDYFKNYLKRLEALTIADVQAAAKKYLKPDNAWIVVAGDKAHAENLKQFADDQIVQFYDINVNPIAAPETKTAEIGAEQIIENYVKALGGVAAIEAVNDYKITGTVNAMGQELGYSQMFKKPEMSLMAITMGGMAVQKAVFDGEKLSMSGMGGSQEFTEGEEFDTFKAEAAVCPPMNFVKNGYQMTVKGIEQVGDAEAYVLDVNSGSVKTYYFDIQSGLLLKTSATTETPQGAMQQVEEYSDYRSVGGMLFPYTVKQKAGGMDMPMTVSSIEVNTGLTAEDFK